MVQIDSDIYHKMYGFGFKTNENMMIVSKIKRADHDFTKNTHNIRGIRVNSSPSNFLPVFPRSGKLLKGKVQDG